LAHSQNLTIKRQNVAKYLYDKYETFFRSAGLV